MGRRRKAITSGVPEEGPKEETRSEEEAKEVEVTEVIGPRQEEERAVQVDLAKGSLSICIDGLYQKIGDVISVTGTRASRCFTLNDDHSLKPVSVIAWAEWLESEANQAKCVVNYEPLPIGYTVSTVFVGLQGQIFETLIMANAGYDPFGLDGRNSRTSTWADAEREHEAARALCMVNFFNMISFMVVFESDPKSGGKVKVEERNKKLEAPNKKLLENSSDES